MEENKELVLAEQQQLAMLSSFEGLEGAGNENVDMADCQTQFLVIIESNSPVLKRSDGKYIKGAEASMILNTVTRDIYDGLSEGINVVPCYFSKEVVEWADKKPVARHSLDSKHYLDALAANRRNAQKRLVNEAGNELTETAYHGVLLLDSDGGVAARAMIGMTSTRLKKSKKWNTLIQSARVFLPNGKEINPPRYAQVYNLKVVPEKNAAGDFYNWEPSYTGLVSAAVFAQAQAYHNELKQNGVAAMAPESSEPSGAGGTSGDDVPF